MRRTPDRVDLTGTSSRISSFARAAVWRVAPRVPPVLLILAAFWAFWPILDNDFVAWDDDKNFLANPWYRGLGKSNLAWAWTTFHLGVYQPLAWMLFGLQFVVFGLDPRGYHLTSLLLHTCVGLGLYSLSLALLARVQPDFPRRSIEIASMLATAFYVVHPLRVEAVAWVSCQGYLSCALFSIFAVLAYERTARPG